MSGAPRTYTAAQIANILLGAIAVILGVLSLSDVVPPTWRPYLTLAISIDAALQRFLPAALGPSAAVADPHGGPPPLT